MVWIPAEVTATSSWMEMQTLSPTLWRLCQSLHLRENSLICLYIQIWGGRVYTILQTWLIIPTTKACRIPHFLPSPVLWSQPTALYCSVSNSGSKLLHSPFPLPGVFLPPLSVASPLFHCGVSLNITSLEEASLTTVYEETLPHQLLCSPLSCFKFFMALIVT